MIRNRSQIAEKVRLLIGDGTSRFYSATIAESAISGSTLVPSDVLAWPDGSSQFFSDETYGRFVSDAYLAVVRELNWLEYAYTTSTVASTSSYATDMFHQIYQVDYDDFPLMPINAAQLYRLDDRWQTRTGRPFYYLMGQTRQWGVGSATLARGSAQTEKNREYQTIRLYPTPTAVADLRIIGMAKPEPLTSPFSTPAMPAWLIDTVTYEAAARILESHTEARNPALAAAYRQIRDMYLNLGRMRRSKRAWGYIQVVGEATRTSYTLQRNTHIPVTGNAPGNPE